MKEKRLKRLCKREESEALRQNTDKITHRKMKSKNKFKILNTHLRLDHSQ